MKVLIAVSDPLFGDALFKLISHHQWSSPSEFLVISVLETTDTSVESADECEYLKNLVDVFSGRLQAIFPEADVSRVIYRGKPADEILKTAAEWKADMVFIGSHGKSGFERAILGSVSNAVVSRCPCSVAVVRLENSDMLNIDLNENDIPNEMKSYAGSDA